MPVLNKGKPKLVLSCLIISWGGGGAGWVVNKFLYGEAPPEVQPLPFYIPFFTKKVPLRITSVDKWYPFYIHRFRTLHPMHCHLNKIKSITKIERFPDFIKS